MLLQKVSSNAKESKVPYGNMMFVTDGEEVAIVCSSRKELDLLLAFSNSGSKWGVRIGDVG